MQKQMGKPLMRPWNTSFIYQFPSPLLYLLTSISCLSSSDIRTDIIGEKVEAALSNEAFQVTPYQQ